MIRGFHSFFGLRHVTMHFIYKTIIHIENWGIRLLRMISLGRILRFNTLGFLGALHSHMVENRILFWYRETSKAFHIYIPFLRKTVVRRDVIFEEDKAFSNS
jgi:hypothetical protein